MEFLVKNQDYEDLILVSCNLGVVIPMQHFFFLCIKREHTEGSI